MTRPKEKVAAVAPSAAPAGFYADPNGGQFDRYWDGVRWTEQMKARESMVSVPPPPTAIA